MTKAEAHEFKKEITELCDKRGVYSYVGLDYTPKLSRIDITIKIKVEQK